MTALTLIRYAGFFGVQILMILISSAAIAQKATVTLPSYEPNGNGYVISNPTFEVSIGNTGVSPMDGDTEVKIAAWIKFKGGTVVGYKYNGTIYRDSDITLIHNHLTPSIGNLGLGDTKVSGSVSYKGSTVGSFSDAVLTFAPVWTSMEPIDNTIADYSVKLDRITSARRTRIEQEIQSILSDQETSEAAASSSGEDSSSDASVSDNSSSTGDSDSSTNSTVNKEENGSTSNKSRRLRADQQSELEKSRRLEAEGLRQAEKGIQDAADMLQERRALKAENEARREQATQKMLERSKRGQQSRDARRAMEARERRQVIASIENGIRNSHFGGKLAEVARSVPAGTNVIYTLIRIEEMQDPDYPINRITKVTRGRKPYVYVLSEKTREDVEIVEEALLRYCRELDYSYTFHKRFKPDPCFIAAARTTGHLDNLLNAIMPSGNEETVQIGLQDLVPELLRTDTEERLRALGRELSSREKVGVTVVGGTESEIIMQRHINAIGMWFWANRRSPVKISGRYVDHLQNRAFPILMHWNKPNDIQIDFMGPESDIQEQLTKDENNVWRTVVGSDGEQTRVSVDDPGTHELFYMLGQNNSFESPLYSGFTFSGFRNDTWAMSDDHGAGCKSAYELGLKWPGEYTRLGKSIYLDEKTYLECYRKVTSKNRSTGETVTFALGISEHMAIDAAGMYISPVDDIMVPKRIVLSSPTDGGLSGDLTPVGTYEFTNPKDDPAKQYFYGREYERVYEDSEKAVELYRKSAEQGYAKAQASLGYMYFSGQGVEKDYKAAIKWYRQAAEQGHAMAQSNLGAFFDNGIGIAVNKEEAVIWFRKAANQGYAHGQYNLGIMYETGKGVPKDSVEAARWFRKAAEQGHENAKSKLD